MQSLMAMNFNYTALRISFLLILFSISLSTIAQDAEYDDEFADIYSDFSVDHLGNLYTLFEKDILTKLVEEDEFEIVDYNYSNRALGEITNFDVTNPLKIIVNHESFSTLVFLDVTLRETAQIYLPDLQLFPNPVAYCLANDNTVWLYDDTNLELIRVNEAGEKVFTSQNLIQQLNFTPQITQLRANKEYLIANDAEKGLLVFDSYGTFIKRMMANEEEFQLVDDSILIERDNQIIQLPINGIGETEIAEIPSGASKFMIQNNKVYFLTSLGVGEFGLE